MAKKKKKRTAEVPSTRVRKLPKFNYRRTLVIAAILIPVLGIYMLTIGYFRFFYITYIYEAIAAALIIWYCVINQGFGKIKIPPNADETTIKDYEHRIVLGKKILTVFFPFLFTIILDLFDLYVIGPLMDAAKNL